MADYTDYKQVRTAAIALRQEHEAFTVKLLKAATHINTEIDRLKLEHKVSANNAEKLRLDLMGKLTHGSKIPEAYNG